MSEPQLYDRSRGNKSLQSALARFTRIKEGALEHPYNGYPEYDEYCRLRRHINDTVAKSLKRHGYSGVQRSNEELLSKLVDMLQHLRSNLSKKDRDLIDILQVFLRDDLKLY